MKVHLRSSDEARNEEVDRLVIEVLRSIDLLDETVLHDNDSRCHGHSLDLVMRNVYERRTYALMNLGELGSHACTELCIEV